MGSVHKKEISNTQAIVSGRAPEVFAKSPSSEFATIILGEGLYPEEISENLYRMYLRFRANVYIDQTEMICENFRLEDLTEIDADDCRSYHVAIFRNRGNGIVSVEACLRLIQKHDARVLPIENEFVEAFFAGPAPLQAVEVSRFISRFDDKALQLRAISSLVSTSAARSIQRGLRPAYGIVEPELEQSLDFLGAPVRRIGEPRFVPDYNDINVGIEIDVDANSRRVGGGVCLIALRLNQVRSIFGHSRW